MNQIKLMSLNLNTICLNVIFINFICILVFNRFETSFVPLGNSSSYLSAGLNPLDCGLRYVPIIINIEFKKECFNENFPNITFVIENNPVIKNRQLIQNRITFGSNAAVGEAPWAVYLTEDHFISEKPLCSGSLITLEWVLTAAHCLRTTEVIYVYAGDIVRKRGQKRKQIKHYLHPKYDSDYSQTSQYNYVYDIGLLKVDSSFTKTQMGNKFTLNTLCLPAKQEQLNQFEENGIVYGFGLVAGYHPDQLQRGDFKLKPSNHSRCTEKSELTGMMCAYFEDDSKEPRACYFDSGSALVQPIDSREKFVVIGIESKGIGEGGKPNFCSPNLPHTNYFSFVPSVVDWIIKIVKEN